MNDDLDLGQLAARSVASPDDVAGRQLLETITVGVTRGELDTFANRAATVGLVPDAVAAALTNYAGTISSFEDVWHPTLGVLQHIRRLPTPSFASAAAVELAIHASLADGFDRWRIRLAGPSRVVVCTTAVDDVAEVL